MPGVRAAAQPAGGAHPGDALDQLRREAQRHHDGDADLVQRAGHGTQQPPRVRQRVRGADAGEHGGQLQAGVHGAEQPFQGHVAAEPHARRPVGQRDLRQAHQHVARHRGAEQRSRTPPGWRPRPGPSAGRSRTRGPTARRSGARRRRSPRPRGSARAAAGSWCGSRPWPARWPTATRRRGAAGAGAAAPAGAGSPAGARHGEPPVRRDGPAPRRRARRPGRCRPRARPTVARRRRPPQPPRSTSTAAGRSWPGRCRVGARRGGSLEVAVGVRRGRGLRRSTWSTGPTLGFVDVLAGAALVELPDWVGSVSAPGRRSGSVRSVALVGLRADGAERDVRRLRRPPSCHTQASVAPGSGS